MDSYSFQNSPSQTSLAQYWAKSPLVHKSGETLVAHTAAVLKRLTEFNGVYPNLSAVCKNDRVWHLAWWSCLFHDFGKVATGFQAQLRPGGAIWGKRHEVLSLAFLHWAFAPEADTDRIWVAAGIVTHHKDLSEISERYPDDDDDEFSAVADLVRDTTGEAVLALANWLTKNANKLAKSFSVPKLELCLSIPADPVGDFRSSAVERITKTLRLVRRLRKSLESKAEDHPDNITAIALRGLVLLSDHSASAHISPARNPFDSPSHVLELLGLNKSDLYRHQELSSITQGNSILTAPTGSGKTESALLWISTQCQPIGRPGRVFYVLPYQASLNAMHNRLSDLFPGSIALQHSKALQSLYRNLLDKGYAPGEALAQARNSRSLARLHHHPIRVLTPYQLLKGLFRLKGYESLITDCVQASFVLDEIHAYEPIRLGMIFASLQYLRATWDCTFLVMSATLSTTLKNELATVIGRHAQIQADARLYQDFVRHRVHVLPGSINDAEAMRTIGDIVARKQSLLLVCNTVKGARRLFETLKLRFECAGVRVDLLHSRFNARDRLRKESDLIKQMGTRVLKSSDPAILVATQVVEVSLDIDFDALISEPAPLEALLQRFGRVNRGRKHDVADVFVVEDPKDGQKIYDPYYVAGAMSIISTLNGCTIDEMLVTSWLDKIYEGPSATEWAQNFKKGKTEFISACTKDMRAFQSSPHLEEKFDELFDGAEVLPATHLSLFQRLQKKAPLEASSLLVPISHRQLAVLRDSNKLRREGYFYVAEVPYDSDFGLQI